MKQDEIVVIIPTISVDSWLDQAVESVLSQTEINPNVLVFHDGVEPDRSRSWMDSARVRWLHSPERVGLSAGLSQAIDATTEPIIARLDADDVASPERLSLQLSYMKQHPDVVLVGTHAEIIDETDRPQGVLCTVHGDDVRSDLLRRNIIVHSSAVFLRSSYEAAGGYNPKLRLFEDYDLWLRMGVVGKIAVIPEKSVFYRVHSSQMSRGAKPWGAHIDAVGIQRKRLAKKLNHSKAKFILWDSSWRLSQFVRYYGLRKPRYDR